MQVINMTCKSSAGFKVRSLITGAIEQSHKFTKIACIEEAYEAITIDSSIKNEEIRF